MKIQTILATKGTQVFTISAGQTVRAATAALMRHNIGALVVVDETGRVVGILSERDIIRAAAHDEAIFAAPVSTVMTRRVIVGSPQDDLGSVMNTMTEKRLRHIPVMEQGKLVGLISIGDVVKAQLAEYEGEIETLQTQIEGD